MSDQSTRKTISFKFNNWSDKKWSHSAIYNYCCLIDTMDVSNKLLLVDRCLCVRAAGTTVAIADDDAIWLNAITALSLQ